MPTAQRRAPRPWLIAVLVVLAIAAVLVAVRASRTQAIPRPAREALTGSWIRSPVDNRTCPPQPKAWSGIADVEGFAVGEPKPGQVTIRMHDGSAVRAVIVRAEGGTMLVRIDAGPARGQEVTLCRLGQGGDVVMASGSVMVTFLPVAGD